jgi:hypothetical protein
MVQQTGLKARDERIDRYVDKKILSPSSTRTKGVHWCGCIDDDLQQMGFDKSYITQEGKENIASTKNKNKNNQTTRYPLPQRPDAML